ncbi:hypothetical protein RUM43_012619 [Polyplax serrata]|uniref:Uncharacterized protein n=1 Tax=Polyplax serrata TaxID=468196 RepID=A0AAN8RYW7_POLSC
MAVRGLNVSNYTFDYQSNDLTSFLKAPFVLLPSTPSNVSFLSFIDAIKLEEMGNLCLIYAFKGGGVRNLSKFTRLILKFIRDSARGKLHVLLVKLFQGSNTVDSLREITQKVESHWKYSGAEKNKAMQKSVCGRQPTGTIPDAVQRH